MTAATQTQPTPEVEAESTGGGIPWQLYPLAPFVIIPAVLLGLWMWPAIAFGALTVRGAAKIESSAWAFVYAVTFGLVFIASFAWPFLLIWGLYELL